VAYGSTGDVSRFQTIKSVARSIVILLWIYLPLQLLTIFGQLRITNKAKDFLQGEISETDFKDALNRNVGSAVGVLVIPIAVLTMVWMYRMAANLRRYGRPGQTWKPGWAVGGWFLPPCGIYAIPWLMFRELWKGSDPAVEPNDPNWKRGSVNPLIDLWWVVYGLLPLAGLVSAAGIGQTVRTGTVRSLAERLRDYGWLNIVLTVVGMVATVIYIGVVRALADRHAQLIREA
jgi:hypothetical protein